jgi:SEC-C motif
MLIFGERHLRSVFAEYARHHNGRRPPRSRQLHPPRPDHPDAALSHGRIKRRPVLSGLINEYERGRVEDQVKTHDRVLEPHRPHPGGAAAYWSVWHHFPVKLQQVPRPNHLDHLSDDGRGYPIISTVGRDEDGADFGSINERRKLALATFDWCAVCGLPFGKAPRWQVVPGSATALDDDQLEEELFFNEAPVHEVCIVYAAHVCPHLSSPGHRMGDQYRAGQRRENKIRMAGFGRTSKVRAFGSGLQKGTHVLHFGQAGFVDEFSYSRPDELADRYAALLASEEVPELSPPESALVSLFNEHGDMGDTVVGAALMAGASFAKDIKKVQGMQVFAKSGYWQGLAVHMLDPEKLAEFGEGTEDRASKFMAGWLLEHQRNLPEVLVGWRKAGQRLARSRGVTLPPGRPEGRGRAVAKNAPCPCGSGRKARRCHPAGLPEAEQ